MQMIRHSVGEMRVQGMTWLQIVGEVRREMGVDALVAARLAHGWDQADAARAWTARWPDDLKTRENFAYWEAWPSVMGYPPSLPILCRLAELYQVAVGDLVEGVGDFRYLDEAQPAWMGAGR